MTVSKAQVIKRQGHDTNSPRDIYDRKYGSDEELVIKVKYFDKSIVPIQRISIGDWIDLRCAQDVTLKKGEHCYLPLGVAMQLPEGYEAWLTSRSSMTKQYKIFHCDDLGVIDNSYCGDNDEWKLPVVALENTTIHKNERVCQFRIAKNMPKVKIVEVEKLGNPDRGGYGSTGKM